MQKILLCTCLQITLRRVSVSVIVKSQFGNKYLGCSRKTTIHKMNLERPAEGCKLSSRPIKPSRKAFRRIHALKAYFSVLSVSMGLRKIILSVTFPFWLAFTTCDSSSHIYSLRLQSNYALANTHGGQVGLMSYQTEQGYVYHS